MNKDGVYLYGASGHAKVIKDIIEASGRHICGVVDDNPSLQDFENLPVSHSATDKGPFIISIGNNSIRKRIAESLNCDYAMAVHPKAVVAESARINAGTVVMAGAIINPDAIIGRHCIINTGVSVDHECVLEDYVHLSPHATLCGNVKVGEGSWIGAGAVVVTSCLDEGCTLVGVPARKVERIISYTPSSIFAYCRIALKTIQSFIIPHPHTFFQFFSFRDFSSCLFAVVFLLAACKKKAHSQCS